MVRFALLVVVFLAGSTVAEARNHMPVTGDSARALKALDGLETKDGELGVTCSAKTDRCTILTRGAPLRWEDNADGEPFFVEQLGFRMDTAAALFAAMPKGTPVEPTPYTTGGYNPVTEVRTLGGNDAAMSLHIQCEQRRYGTECTIRKVTEKGPETELNLNCTETNYPTSYPLTLLVVGHRATLTPRAYGQEAEGVDFKVEATLGTGSLVNVRGSGFEFSVVPTYGGGWAGTLRAPGMHAGDSVELRCSQI